MVQLTKERVFIVLNYTQTQNTTAVQNAIRPRFPDRDPPHKTTILRSVRKYSSQRTSLNLNKGNSGRRRTARIEQNIAAVRTLFEQNRCDVSARRNSAEISSSGFNRITRLDLRWHPYRMHVRHELLATDLPRRLRFAEWFIQRCRRGTFLPSIIIGDEAAFAMDGEANSHNVRQYSPKGHPPVFNFERSNSRAKLTVWAALSGNGVILGPYFFDGNVNGMAYLQSLNEFAFPQLVHFGNQHLEDMFRGLCWVQDGAPAHRLIEVRDRLNRVFGNNRAIGLGHDVEWPPRSPDLTPCDFFLWGYLKDKVFSTSPQNIDELRQRIVNTFNALRQQPDFIR